MSSLFVNPDKSVETAKRIIVTADFARLIPGEIAAIRSGAKKRAASVREAGQEKRWKVAELSAASTRKDKLSFLLPPPMQTRNAWNWLRSVSADLALITLNWLLIGALLVPTRIAFPHTRLFANGAGAPAFLLGVALLHGALITLIGYSGGLYDGAGELPVQSRTLANSVLWSTALLAIAFVLLGSSALRIGLLLAAGVLHLLTLSTRREAFWQPRQADVSPDNTHNVLIVGAGAAGRQIATQFHRCSRTAKNLCGFLDDERPLDNEVIGRVSDLAFLARRAFIDEVILAPPVDRSLAHEVVREARRLRLDVKIVPDLFGCKAADSTLGRIGDMPVIHLHGERFPAASLACKRGFDIVAAAFALIVLLPVLAIIAVLIKLDSPGPVFYVAKRAGRKGMPFRCLKFRTMVSNADELKDNLRKNNQRSGPFFKIADDPRITLVGRLLRRYSLDELPQLWNVLCGEMSLVGPRPHPLDDFAGYQIEHLSRLDMTPGITGLWQVTARRDPSFERGMELDREYIQRWNLRLDLRILMKTVGAVVRGGGE